MILSKICHTINTEGSKLSDEVHSTLSNLVDRFVVVSPVKFVIQLNIKVFLLLHLVPFFSHEDKRT